ncbi:MAG: hypothetical protein Q9160_006187 [Pyrenula sp. 1 TL-2023]
MMPVPNELMAIMALINVSRIQRTTMPSLTNPADNLDYGPLCTSIFSGLELFDPAAWASKVVEERLEADSLAQTTALRVSRNENPAASHATEEASRAAPSIKMAWIELALCYRASIQLYAISTLLDEHEPDLSRAAMREHAYRDLLSSIHSLFRRKDLRGLGATFHKFILWPLVVAGVECAIHFPAGDEFDYICRRVLEMSGELGTLSMRDAAVFLVDLWRSIWSRGDDGSTGREEGDLATTGSADGGGGGARPTGSARFSWDSIFGSAPLFMM